MTRSPKTVRADDTCADALRLMRSADVGHLPVLDGDRLVGILTRGDILRRAPVKSAGDDFTNALFLSHVSVSGVMTYAPVTTEASTPVVEVIELMLERRLDAIAVMQGTKLVGIFTRFDALRMIAAALRGEGRR